MGQSDPRRCASLITGSGYNLKKKFPRAERGRDTIPTARFSMGTRESSRA